MTTTSAPDADLLTQDEVAAILKISRKTLANWRSIGQGPRGFRVGRGVRWHRVEVTRWLREQEATDPLGDRAHSVSH